MHGAGKHVNAGSEVLAVQSFLRVVAAVRVTDEEDGTRNARSRKHGRVMSDSGHAAGCDFQWAGGVLEERDQLPVHWRRRRSYLPTQLESDSSILLDALDQIEQKGSRLIL